MSEISATTSSLPMAPLLALSSAYFMVGTCSLCVIGLVLPISENLNISPPDVAWLVTVFALTFAVAAPLGQILFSRLARVRILCGGLFLMAGGMALAAFAPDYETLFISRAILGVGAALVSPMCSALGAGMVAPHQQGRAMAIVFGGLTVATVVGVPLSAWLGSQIGWRTVMAIIAVTAMVSMSAILVLVRDRSAGAASGIGHLIAALTERRSSLAILATFLQMASLFCTYALIAPYMVYKFEINPDEVFLMLLIYGSFGVLGNVFAGRFSDRFGPDRVIIVSIIATTLAFLAMLITGSALWIGLAILCIWAVTGMIFHTPQQQRIVSISVDQRSLLLALNASALYLGMSLGAGISRTASIHWGYDSLPALSAGVMMLCGLVFFASTRSLKAVPAR